jgi:hypothetical protein
MCIYPMHILKQVLFTVLGELEAEGDKGGKEREVGDEARKALGTKANNQRLRTRKSMCIIKAPVTLDYSLYRQGLRVA